MRATQMRNEESVSAERRNASSGALDAAPDQERQFGAHIDMRFSAGWMALMILGVVFAHPTPLTILWACAMFMPLLFVKGVIRLHESTGISPRRLRFLTGGVAITTALIFCLMPVWMATSGDFAMAAAGAALLAAGAMLSTNYQAKGKDALIVLVLRCAALFIGPVYAAATDPKGEWGPYIFVMYCVALLAAAIFHTRATRQKMQADMQVYVKEVRHQENLTRMMFDQASFTVCLLDEKLNCVRVNAGFRRMSPNETPIGRSIFDFIRAETDELKTQMQRSLAGETIRADEIAVLNAAGAKSYFGFETAPWRDGEEGGEAGVVCFIWDSTERVLAQKEMTRRAECLDIALHASMSAVLEYDLRGNTLRWFGDPALVYGRRPEDSELLELKPSLFPESDAKVVTECSAQIFIDEHTEYEHRFHAPDGSINWMNVCGRLIRGEDGQPASMIYKMTNITQSKREQEDLLEALGRAAQSLAAKRSLLAEVAQAAGAEYGFELDEQAVGQKEASLSASLTGVSEIVERFKALLAEVEVRDDALSRAVMSLRKARETSEAANLAKSQFLANMSHELRTPLNAIIGYSEILCEDARDDGREADVKDHDRILAAARSLLTLINEILDLSKIEAGRMDIAIGDYDVRKLVDEAVSTVRLQAEKNGNEVMVTIDPALASGRSDAFKINQCLLNLLSNAAKFTKDGVVGVQANLVREGHREWLQLSVADTGIGMTEEQSARLFRPFTQADASTTREYGGTGLGLVITRRMCQLLGGDISLHTVKDEGSTFTIRLPLNLETFEQEELANESLDLGGDANGPLVLIIDDEADVADLVQRSIGRLGFRVLAASTGASGLRAAETRQPAVILLDINLPDRSGWSLLEQITTTPATQDIPVIVHSIHDDRQRALLLGACDHLVKPSDRDVLAAAVARFARRDAADAANNEQTETSAPVALKQKLAG